LKVLLIYPPFQVGRGMGTVMCSPPLSLLTLAGAVQDLNHEIEILDMNADNSYGNDELEEKIRQFDLVGITCMTNAFRFVLKICKIAKRINVQTILGGFHPTLMPNIIDEFDCIDMICRGEGEHTFRELLEGIPKEEILGLSYRENGSVRHNPERPYIKDLNTLPLPHNNLVMPKPYHYLWVKAWVCETSRGCPFNCSFCCVTQFYHGRYRAKTPERVIKELMRIPPSTKLVFFTDDNYCLSKKRVLRICELIRKYNIHKKLMFVCQSRVDDIANNPDMVEAMSKAGFICVFLGIESLKQMSIDIMNKQYSLKNLRKAIKLCHKNGIIIFGSFIVGNIGETVEDTWNTFKMMKILELDFMMASPITPFPGTPLYDEASKKGWIPEDFKWETWDLSAVMKTPDMTRSDIQELVDESYNFFYKDLGYMALSRKSFRMIYNPKFWWFRKVAFSFLLNGLTKYYLK
jgi:anaerobic magnesium-protoporphyrin IX monomethyl ester cyclase